MVLSLVVGVLLLSPPQFLAERTVAWDDNQKCGNLLLIIRVWNSNSVKTLFLYGLCVTTEGRWFVSHVTKRNPELWPMSRIALHLLASKNA